MTFEKKVLVDIGVLLTITVIVIAIGASTIDFNNMSYVSPNRIILVCGEYGVGWINTPNISQDKVGSVKYEILKRVKTLVSEGWDPILALNEIASKPVTIEKVGGSFVEVRTSIWFDGRPLKFSRDCEYASSTSIGLDLEGVNIYYGGTIDWNSIIDEDINIKNLANNQTD